MNIYLIRPICFVMPIFEGMVVSYRQLLEGKGHKVYDPGRDTDSDVSELEICKQNLEALKKADEVHVFLLNGDECLFELGMAFALEKKIKAISPFQETAYKSVNNLLRQLMLESGIPVGAD